MPTYVYACTNPDCAHQFEAVQSFTDDALTVCPVCGQRLRKVFGSVGVVFKGSGFYRNDSREKSTAGAKTPAPSSGSDKGNGAASEGGKSESSGAKADTASHATTESSATSGSGRSGAKSESAGSTGSSSAGKTSSDKSAASTS